MKKREFGKSIFEKNAKKKVGEKYAGQSPAARSKQKFSLP